MEFDLADTVTLEAVRHAASRLEGLVKRTPIMTSHSLDKLAGRKLFFKCEHLQTTGSFKVRGAIYALQKLADISKQPTEERILTSSTGNFGMGLAYAARLMGMKDCTVLMKKSALQYKKDAVRSYGAKVMEFEISPQEDKEKLFKERGAMYFGSNASNDVSTGQGTLGLELLEEVPDLDAIIVPIGGGGMISGVAAVAKALNPKIKIIGVEPESFNSCYVSLKAGKIIPTSETNNNTTIADGLACSINIKTWPIIRDLVDDVIVLTEDEIKEGTRLTWKYMKQCVEPSSGAGIAAVLNPKFQSLVPPESKNIGVILCGGNLDLEGIKDWM